MACKFLKDNFRVKVLKDSPVLHCLEKEILMPLSSHNWDQINLYICCMYSITGHSEKTSIEIFLCEYTGCDRELW